MSRHEAKDGKDEAAGVETPDGKGASPDPIRSEACSFLRLYAQADALDRCALALGVLGAAINAPTMPVFAYVFGETIDAFFTTVTDEELKDEVRRVVFWFIGLAAATLVGSFLEVSMFMWAGARQVSRLRTRYLRACLGQEQAYYDTEATSGHVLSGLNEDCQAVQNAISEKVGNALHHLGAFVVAIGIGFWRGWRLTLVMLALSPLLVVAGGILAKIVGMGEARLAKSYAAASVQTNQAFGNMRTIASFQAEESTFDKYAAILAAPTKTQQRISTASGLAGGFINTALFVTYGCAFLYAGRLTRDNIGCDPDDADCYTSGRVMTVIFSVVIGTFSLGQASPSWPAFAIGKVAGGRIFSVIDRAPLIDLDAGGVVPEQRLAGDIEMREVTFAYPARADVPVLQRFALSVAPGQTVALVGASGSGKSTVVQLLQRFYDPLGGSIAVDGHALHALDLRWFRDQVGLVAQEPTLFATSIRENIAMGREGASDRDVEDAARAANAHHFIEDMPGGYHTQVGERGVQLSGGQKQRVAIARALLKNPSILLLDEATSALDTVSERLVQHALERLSRDRTTIVIAHRLSTIRGADKIVVMRDGAAVEEGTHDDLYANPASVYHSLVQLQQQATDMRIKEGLEDELAEEEALITSQPSGRTLSSKRAIELRHASKRRSEALAAAPEQDELTEEEKQVDVKFRRLLSLVQSEWAYIVVGIAAAALGGAVMPALAVVLSETIDRLDPLRFDDDGNVLPGRRPYSQVVEVAVIFFALAAFLWAMAVIQAYCFAVAGARLAQRARKLFFRAVLSMEVAWFDRDENTSGALSSRLQSDAPRLRGAVADTMGLVVSGLAVQNLSTFVVAYIVAFINGWRITLVLTAVIPILAAGAYVHMKFFTGFDNKGATYFALANQTANESITALRTVNSFNMQDRVVRLYARMLRAPNRRSAHNAFGAGAALGVGQAAIFLFDALGFWYGGEQVLEDRVTPVEMLKVVSVLLFAAMGASQAQIGFPDVAHGKAATARLFRVQDGVGQRAVIDREPLIDARSDVGDKPASCPGAVRLHAVDFAYPTRPDLPVFKGFTLDIAPGKVTALVGESGSGKSTVVALIERFYDVDGGQVLVDGADVRQLSLPWLRRQRAQGAAVQVGLVSQEPALFIGTIAENVRFGKPDASDAEVAAACEVANALEFIERAPERFETRLGEGGGISLSGGQKQRIAIARAVLKDPRILLLDEATSALDAESERLVQDALDKLMVGRTSVVIAHRLTTIRNADSIAVVQAGVVLEQGTHSELMAQGERGAYVKLARAQAGT